MDKKQLLIRLQRRVKNRYGTPVTERMLQDWVYEDLVPQAKPLGRKRGLNPDWQWECTHYRRALQICRIKSYGIKRYSDIRICLWFRGVKLPFPAVRDSLLKTFRINRNKLLKPITSDFDPERTQSVSPRRQRALIKQMGERSSLLPNLNIPASESIELLKYLYYTYPTFRVGKFITSLKIIKRKIPTLYLAAEYFNCLSSILGDADEIENSGIDWLKNADQQTYETARELFKYMPWILRTTGLSLKRWLPSKWRNQFIYAAEVINKDPWRIMVFAPFIILASRNPEFIVTLRNIIGTVRVNINKNGNT